LQFPNGDHRMNFFTRILSVVAALFVLSGAPGRAALYDMVEMTVASAPGTGTVTLGIAVPPYRSLSATSVVSGETVSYHIADGTKWENGRGVVNLSPNITITRGVVSSSNANGLIFAGPGATVWITPLASDMVLTQYSSTINAAVAETPCALTSAATVTVSGACDVYTLTVANDPALLGNPTSTLLGQWQTFFVTQDGTGKRRLAFDTNYIFAGGMNTAVLSTGAGKTDAFACKALVANGAMDCTAPVLDFYAGSRETWSATHKNASFTLSNGNLTATAGTISSDVTAFGSAGLTAGNFFFEIDYTGSQTNCCNGVGLGNINTTTVTGQYLGIDNNGIIYGDTGTVTSNGATLATIASYTSGAKICIAANLTTNMIWFQPIGTGQWDNNGTDNPATGTGGVSIANVATAAVTPGGDANNTGVAFVLNTSTPCAGVSGLAGFSVMP
jgi:hypothetical protein